MGFFQCFCGAYLRHFICSWLLLFAPLAFSINTDQWLIQKLQVDDGLPNATVFSVQQDQDGFIWFGTVSGVARYDGYGFKVFQHDGVDLNSLSNNNAGNIFIDSKNILWVGTFGGGFNTIDLETGNVTRFPYSSDQLELVVPEFVQTFYEDSQSNIWIGTPNGLFKFTDKVVKQYKHHENNDQGLIHSRVWDMAEDQTGKLWIATSQGLSQLNPDSDEITNFPLPSELVEEISSSEFRKLYLSKDELWIGSSSALYLFDLTTLKYSSYPLKYNIKINDLMQVGNTFFVATMGGLYQFDRIHENFLTDSDGDLLVALRNIDLRRMLVDESGLLWIVSRDNGVFKIDQTGGLFTNQVISYPDGVINELGQQIWAIESDPDGKAYLGTSDTLLIETTPGQFTPIGTATHQQIPGRIRALKWDNNQNLWIGSSDGLFVLNKGKLVANEVREPYDLVGIKPADVFSIEVTHNGEVWLSLSNLGVLRWSPTEHTAQLIQKHQELELTNISIGKVMEDAEHNIWLTSDLVGLIKYDRKLDQMIVLSHDYSGGNSIASNRVRDVYEDGAGRLWVGTEKGISLYQKQSHSFQHMGTAEGLLDESIYAIVEDSKNNFWVTHNFGISRINQSLDEIRNFKINSTIRKDGLNIRAAGIDHNDQLLLGSNNGLYEFDPSELKTCIKYRPSLLLTEVTINNTPLTAFEMAANGNHFELFHQDRSIFFEFSALEYSGPDHVQYEYRVAGVNDIWHDVTNSRSIELSSLKPGDYVLEIKASNSDCRWSEQSLNVSIQVHPVWWNLWWVRLLFIFGGIAIALLMHFFRSKIIRKRNLELEQLVENRTSELMLLNEKLKAASHIDFLTGLNNRAGFVNQYNQLEKIGSQSFVVLADIDHFKKVNDSFGHLAGDSVLVKVANIMQSYVKQDDFVARWGGEEFIFYFDNKTAAEMYELAEQIRVEIQSTPIHCSGEEILVTCTMGICQIEQGMDLNQCIKAADESMYKGKSKGRNTTMVSPLKTI